MHNTTELASEGDGRRCQSFAQWPAGTCPGDISFDSHESKKHAEGVCRRLNKEGFGGQGKVFPIKTWTETV